MPLTEDTRATAISGFEAMQGTTIINFARGELVDNVALFEALEVVLSNTISEFLAWRNCSTT